MFASKLLSLRQSTCRWAAVAVAVAMCGGANLVADDEVKTSGFTTGSSDEIIQYINERVTLGWTDNEIKPSAVADDAEWVRRAYLDIVGHIPSADEAKDFIKSTDSDKRAKLIEQLLEHPDYVTNFTTVWTNLSIGRRNIQRVSRNGMQRFYREAFARNTPWDEVITGIMSAEGHFERDGAVNYWLAQMQDDDEAVQATAKTTRLFMGIQVQCTQCHNHPFNDWKQDQFWSFNSFFRQLRKNEVQKYDPESGRMVDDYTELVSRNADAEVFFEKRSGLMQVAYPNYFGKEISTDSSVNRRVELGKLMIEGEQPLIATAFVNRMWSHFFGYGFTRPVDDMGPHNPASHPELLDRLAQEFVKANYDVKQLVRWIANSEAYNLSSRFGPDNEIDAPSAGETPLFSHMYIKAMTPEQLFDSLIAATDAHKSGRTNWEESENQRRRWMQQFVVAFDTDEADEATNFNGTIPQALMMMNGPLIQNAIDTKKGSYLYNTLSDKGSDSVKIQQLFLATLSRFPTRTELQAARNIAMNSGGNKLQAYQDLFWALLNSNEFIFVH